MRDEAKRLKVIRKALALTQSVFAEGLGLKQGPYSMIESGKVGLSSDVLRKLIGHYKVNPLFLFQGQQPMLLDPDSNTQVFRPGAKPKTGDSTIDIASLPALPKTPPAIDPVNGVIGYERIGEIRRTYLASSTDEKDRIIEELVGACEYLKDENAQQKDKIITLMGRMQDLLGRMGM